MTIYLDASGKLLFSKIGGREIEIIEFDPNANNEAKIARAKEILHLYGGYEKYKSISSTTQFSSDQKYCTSEGANGSPPLQTFPNGSPLYLVKKELAKNDDAIQPVTFFSDNSQLTAEQIKQIKEDQKNVVRLAVKSKLVGTDGSQLSDEDIKQKCFADKEASGGRLSDANYGLMSSYIAPTTFYLNQSHNDNLGKKAAQKADKPTRAYITGFGYPLFDENYINAINGDQKKQTIDELKAIFKQQIYAVLLSRQQQVDSKKIDENIKVPLILNRAYDFVRVYEPNSVNKAKELQKFINETLVELFSDQGVADAMKGKIDKVLFLDGVKTIGPDDGHKEGVEFFGDIALIEKALRDSESGVEALKINGHDMISLAQAYQEGSGAMIAIPIMANPKGQDGEGSMKGLNAAEESLNVAMGAMMQMLLNGKHNKGLEDREIKDSMNLSCFKAKEKVEIENSTPQPTFQDNLKSYGVPIVAGLAGAGAVVLCASALGLGIVPITVVAVVVGVACVGATATAVSMEQNKEMQQSK